MFRGTSYFVLSLLLAISLAEIEEEENVLVLTSENFEEALSKHKFMMVEFYAPWCGHCKALAPEYAEAAGKLKEEKSELKLAKIDATENKEIAQLYQVGGYPTLKYFRSGKPLPYKGGRTAQPIIDWMKKKAAPPAKTLSTVEDAKKFVDEGDVSIVGFFEDLEGSKAKNFFLAADDLDDFGYTFGITSDPKVKESYDVTDDGMILFKPFDEKRNDFPKEKPFSVEEIKKFIIPNSLPVLTEFEVKYAPRVFHVSNKIGALWLILSSTSEGYSAIKEDARKIAEEFKGKILTVILDSEAEGSERFIGMVGAEGEDMPLMRFAHGWSAKYMPKSNLAVTEEGMRTFIKDQFGKQNTQITWSKTEEIPDDWDKEPVKVLVGKNFGDVVTSYKNVFVEFYAPWCGHCKALTPTWNELGEKLKDRQDIMIAKLEATSNTVDRVGVRSYPTLILFQGSVSNQIKYDNERNLEGFLSFLGERGIKVEDKKDKKDEL